MTIQTMRNLRAQHPPPFENNYHPEKLSFPYHPGDVWELTALREAIMKELLMIAEGDSADDAASKKGKGKGKAKAKGKAAKKNEVSAEHTLYHILHCWNWNFKRLQTAGPEFLIHFVGQGHEEPGSQLSDDDWNIVEMLNQVCIATQAFQLFLAQVQRKAWGTFIRTGRKELFSADRMEMRLEDVEHMGDRQVVTVPSITDVDLLDDMYFEDKDPDEKGYEEVSGEGSKTRVAYQIWKRTALIIVPDIAGDNFFGHLREPADEKEVGESEGEERQETNCIYIKSDRKTEKEREYIIISSDNEEVDGEEEDEVGDEQEKGYISIESGDEEEVILGPPSTSTRSKKAVPQSYGPYPSPAKTPASTPGSSLSTRYGTCSARKSR